MKTQLLAVRFSDVTDSQMALSLLRQCKQTSGQLIQNYAERILSLPKTAYDAIERQPIDIFVNRLATDQLKNKKF